MPDHVLHLAFWQILESKVDPPCNFARLPIDNSVRTLLFVNLLDLRKCKLDRVVLRGIGDVEDGNEVELPHVVEGGSAPMDAEIVHKDEDLLLLQKLAQDEQELLELVDVDGLVVALPSEDAMLLCNGTDHGSSFSVHPLEVHHNVVVPVAELALVEGPHCEHDLVNVDDCTTHALSLLHLFAESTELRDLALPLTHREKLSDLDRLQGHTLRLVDVA